VEEGFDVAIRAGRLPDTSLVARRLGDLPGYVVASPRYLEGRPPPERPEDLVDHTCLNFGAPRATWTLVSPERVVDVKVEGRLAVNASDVLREAAVGGSFVPVLPHLGCVGARRAGKLVRLLPEWTSEEPPIHGLFPSRRHLSARVK